MKKSFVALTAFAALFCGGCNSLVISLPVSRFDSPEVMGGTWKKSLNAGLSGNHTVTVVQDGSQRPPDTGAPTIADDFNLPARFALGFWDRLEIGARYDFLGSPFMGNVKLQILGDAADKAKKDNFSVAVTAAYGTDYSSNSGSQEGTFGPGGFHWSAAVTTQVADFAAVVGLRLSDYVLLYGGPFITKYNMSGYVQDDASSDGTSPAAKYGLSASGQNSGGNFAVQWSPAGPNFSVTLEGVYSSFQWSGPGTPSNVTSNDIQAGAIMGWIF